MMKILMDIPYIENVRIIGTYTGKDDAKAAELYNKNRNAVAEKDMHEGDSRIINILTETLFTASVTSRLFLDALLDCAKYWYNLKVFVNCLRYCECMLALPAKFYDQTAKSKKDFLEYRDACMHLRNECSKKLKVSSSRRKMQYRKKNTNEGFSSEETSFGTNTATIPVVDGKRHAVLENCSDAVALQFDEKRGRHLVATRNIKAGSVLIVDRPFAFSTDKGALNRNCLNCHVTLILHDSVKIPCRSCRTVFFCSEKCRKEAWQTYHRYECSVFNSLYEGNSEQTQQTSHLLLAYRMTTIGVLSSNNGKVNNVEDDEIPLLNDNFLQFHATNENKKSNNLGITQIYSSLDYHTILELETHYADFEPKINLIRAIEAIFLAKCFAFVLSTIDVVCSKQTFLSLAIAMLHHLQAVNCNAYEIVENVYNKKTHVWEPRYVGGAIYPSVSLVNHSCYPNIVRHSYPSGIVVVRTLRFIGKDTEILDCYGPHFLSEGKFQRREYLWKKYRFLCACEACAQNWQYPLPEAMNYKCRACSKTIDIFPLDEIDIRHVLTTQCNTCKSKIDLKKLYNQFKKSVEKRVNAISKMYEGYYEQALPQLLEHMHFIDKFFVAPNIETIKTQQCIIQCYNQFGCTSQ
ncbi:protein-lysine N-methyltransferase SMYD4 isoform X2 [Calliopsis andreniformis]